MKETKPTTPRLRKLEAEKERVKHDNDFVRVPIYTRLDGYLKTIEDLWPVVEAAQDLIENVGPDLLCIFCMVSTYKSRADIQHSTDCRISIFRDALAAVVGSPSREYVKAAMEVREWIESLEPKMTDQQPVPDEAKLTDERKTEIEIADHEGFYSGNRTHLIRAVAKEQAEKAWHSRDAEFDAYYDEVSRVKMEVAKLQRQLDTTLNTLHDLNREHITPLREVVDMKMERDAAREQVRALVEALMDMELNHGRKIRPFKEVEYCPCTACVRARDAIASFNSRNTALS